MIEIEELRQIVTAEFVVFHATFCASLVVEYPNKDTVDIENQEEDFISLAFVKPKVLSNSIMGADGFTQTSPELWVYYFTKRGKGESASCRFADDLIKHFLYQRFEQGLECNEIQSNPVEFYKDWKTDLYRLRFRSTGFNTIC